MQANRSKKPLANREHEKKADPGREAWTLLLRLLRSEQANLLDVWAEFDLSSAQGDLLCSLEPGQSSRMVSLARTLHCHDSNVTGLVDRLEERGVLERRGDPEDRRVKLIALTRTGESLRERLLDRLSDPLPFVASLTLQDKVLLRDILRRASQQKR